MQNIFLKFAFIFLGLGFINSAHAGYYENSFFDVIQNNSQTCTATFQHVKSNLVTNMSCIGGRLTDNERAVPISDADSNAGFQMTLTFSLANLNTLMSVKSFALIGCSSVHDILICNYKKMQ